LQVAIAHIGHATKKQADRTYERTKRQVQTFWTQLVLALVSGFPGSIASISVRRKKPKELDEDSTK
jgi:hypothetical protein